MAVNRHNEFMKRHKQFPGDSQLLRRHQTVQALQHGSESNQKGGQSDLRKLGSVWLRTARFPIPQSHGVLAPVEFVKNRVTAKFRAV